jgi:AAHS family 4-hydroxybenzoate transporter-like MFS transporter
MLASLLWSAYPLGNAAGGFMTGYIVTHHTWRTVFYVGGIPALLAAAALALFLPESLRFLAATGKRPRTAERLARRLDPALPAGPLRMVIPSEAKAGGSWRALFTQGRAVSTLLLWLIFFLAFGTTTLIVLWTPTLLRSDGMPLGTAATLVGVYSLAAVAGMAVAGHLVNRFGAIVALAPAFVLGGGLLAGLGSVAWSPVLAGCCMVLLGVTVPLGAAGGIALAATYYPTEIRTSGVGWAMGMGRFGQVCSPLAIGWMLSLAWEPGNILAVMSAAPVLAGVAILLRTRLGARPVTNLEPVHAP